MRADLHLKDETKQKTVQTAETGNNSSNLPPNILTCKKKATHLDYRKLSFSGITAQQNGSHKCTTIDRIYATQPNAPYDERITDFTVRTNTDENEQTHHQHSA